MDATICDDLLRAYNRRDDFRFEKLLAILRQHFPSEPAIPTSGEELERRLLGDLLSMTCLNEGSCEKIAAQARKIVEGDSHE